MLSPDELKKIDLFLEEIYPESEKMGKALAESGLRNTQIRGLETLISSASRFSEIINYVKNQTGRDKKGQWQKVAYDMLNQFSVLENEAKKIGNDDPVKILSLKLKLVKGWIKQVISNYYIGSKFFGDSTINNPSIKVFINYAKEDWITAKRIYDDLTHTSISPWIDVEDLIPGQNWRKTIQETISSSTFFLALLSSNSVTKKGFVQKELKVALEVFELFPPTKVFIIPVRLDDCKPIHKELEELHWVDLFPSYEKGFDKILRALQTPKN